MKAIFIVVFLIPAVGCFDVLTYAIEVKGCILKSILGAEKLCETSTDQDCFYQQGMTLGKQCLKPALAKFISSFDDLFKLTKPLEETILCALDRVFDDAKICIPPTHESNSEDEDKVVIDIVACVAELFPSSMRKCYNLQHNNMMHEL